MGSTTGGSPRSSSFWLSGNARARGPPPSGFSGQMPGLSPPWMNFRGWPTVRGVWSLQFGGWGGTSGDVAGITKKRMAPAAHGSCKVPSLLCLQGNPCSRGILHGHKHGFIATATSWCGAALRQEQFLFRQSLGSAPVAIIPKSCGAKASKMLSRSAAEFRSEYAGLQVLTLERLAMETH